MARRVPVARVTPGAGGDEVLEFTDGTTVEIEVRDGAVALGRLARRTPRPVAYLSRVQPCLGRFWFRLRFSSVTGTSVEVLARVNRFESVWSRFWRGPGRRWPHPFGEHLGGAQR